MNKLESVYINNWCYYIASIIVITLAFRLLITFLKSMEYISLQGEQNIDKKNFAKRNFFKRVFIMYSGFSKLDPNPDRFYNTLIGTFELFIFPVLMKADQYSIIGAWIGLKTVAQWHVWSLNRDVFNRFILSHAILLLVCFLWLTKFVSGA